MGAWIETSFAKDLYICVFVAPYMGAWIETDNYPKVDANVRRTLYGCVD